MAGCRPLSLTEESALRRIVRTLSPRDRALVVTQWLTGFRIAEVLSLKVGNVLRDGRLVSKIGIAPRHMKGGYGSTRWVPVLPELARGLETWLRELGRHYKLTADLPLFLSRESTASGEARGLSREMARLIVHRTFRRAGIVDDGRLGTHTLRKTFAKNVYTAAGKDLMVLKKALNHSSVAVTQRYLEVVEEEVVAAIRRCDRSRQPRRAVVPFAIPTAAPVAKGQSVAATAQTEQLDFLGTLCVA